MRQQSRTLRALALACCALPVSALSLVWRRVPAVPACELLRSSAPLATATATADSPELPRIDWSFLDAAFMITCPNEDGSNPRVDRALALLEQVGLGQCTEVREFERDDEDRVRGCYTSHIAILQEAQQRMSGADDYNVLVLEDNIAVSTRIAQETLDAVSQFVVRGGEAAGGRVDMVHLAYIMYVPGLSVEQQSSQNNIVKLRCSPDSVLGTTAYIITRRGLDAILDEHATRGYVDAIPNVMARLFADSRFAAFPMPFHRAATIKSLVNSQLDVLRSVLFTPQVFTLWERLLVGSGQNTNFLFPALCVVLLVGALAGGAETASALLAKSRGEQVDLILPALSALVATPSLAILGYGLSLAPKPQPPVQQPPPPTSS